MKKSELKEVLVDGEPTFFKYDNYLEEWMASFSLYELRSFVKRIRERVKQEGRK